MLHALMLSALLTAQTADTVSTVRLLQRPGFSEANPFLPSKPSGIVAVKVGMTTGVVFAGWKIRKTHPKVAVLLYAIGAVSGSVGAISNARYLHEGRR